MIWWSLFLLKLLLTKACPLTFQKTRTRKIRALPDQYNQKRSSWKVNEFSDKTEACCSQTHHALFMSAQSTLTHLLESLRQSCEIIPILKRLSGMSRSSLLVRPHPTPPPSYPTKYSIQYIWLPGQKSTFFLKKGRAASVKDVDYIHKLQVRLHVAYILRTQKENSHSKACSSPEHNQPLLSSVSQLFW